jgi:hypothetical protein
MKAIQPVTLWVNGQQQQADFLNAVIVNDNLSTSATFFYELIDQVVTPSNDPEGSDHVANIVLASGNITIDGQEYTNWGASADINDDAYAIIAGKLNLTLV